MKIKLIKQLEKKMGMKNSFRFDDTQYVEGKLELGEKYIKNVQKTFRTKKEPTTFYEGHELLVTLYRNVASGIIKSKKCKGYYEHSINEDVLERHFDLLSMRNQNLKGYSPEKYDYELKTMVVAKEVDPALKKKLF